MQRTNIFIASSSEMHYERLVIVDLLTDMCSDTMRYIPMKWEYMDSAVHQEHKQSEYMRRLQKCEICIVMFWRSLGEYTEKELSMALEEQSKAEGNNLQRTFVLFKEDGESVKPELQEFKEKFEQRHGDIVYSFSNDHELRELTKKLVCYANVKCKKDNWNGKEVKVMIAADEELDEEKLEFTELIAHLNEVLESRGIRLRREKWTPHGADDFREKLLECGMCLNLYWTKMPQQADKEMRIAYDLSTSNANPRHLYIFFKEPSDNISMALSDFKAAFETRYGHFFCKFENVDTMNLHFLLQFEASENVLEHNCVKVEGGDVTLDGIHVASMDNLPFASKNERYKDIQLRIKALNDEIDQLWNAIQLAPQIPSLRVLHQQKLDEYNGLKKKFEIHQQALFNTAKRISEMQQERVSRELQRAIEEFEAGRLEAANAILDGMRGQIIHYKEQIKREHAIGHEYVIGLLLQANILMADGTLQIEERIQRTLKTYQEADELAKLSLFPKDKNASLLSDYGNFLYTYSMYEDALNVYERKYHICEDLYGVDNIDSIMTCNHIGQVYSRLGDYDRALKCYNKALSIGKKSLGTNHINIALILNNMGLLYSNHGEYEQAFDSYYKALKIKENVLGAEHLQTSITYNNIGSLYYKIKDKDGALENALKYFKKVLTIRERMLGPNHPKTGTIYNNIGLVYSAYEDYELALDYYLRALVIKEKTLGLEHLQTSTSYNNVGSVYHKLKAYKEALDYYQKALAIRKKKLGDDHPDTATSYNNIGLVYSDMGEDEKAIEFYKAALKIKKNKLGNTHPDIATIYNNIRLAYEKMGEYDEALDYYQKAKMARGEE